MIEREGKGRLVIVLTVVGLLIAAIGLLFGDNLFGRLTDMDKSTGTILTPLNGDQIPQAIEARGTATNIPASHQLWLFLARAGSDRWLRGNGVWGGVEQSYLQIKDGYWYQGDLEFGAKEDPPGDQYELALVVLGPVGINRMQTYSQDGIPRDEVLSYPDTILLDTIRIYRK